MVEDVEEMIKWEDTLVFVHQVDPHDFDRYATNTAAITVVLHATEYNTIREREREEAEEINIQSTTIRRTTIIINKI